MAFVQRIWVKRLRRKLAAYIPFYVVWVTVAAALFVIFFWPHEGIAVAVW